MTSSVIVALFSIATYLSVSEPPPANAAKPLPEENPLAKFDRPERDDNKSVFSAGKTDALDRYHFGESTAYIEALTVTIKTNQNKNQRYLTVTVMNSKRVLPTVC